MGNEVTAPGTSWPTLSPPRQPDGLRPASAGDRAGGTPPPKGAELARACQDLESLFLTYLLKEMRATIPKNGLLSGGKAEEICTSLADAQLAQELAARGGIGISKVLLTQLSLTQFKEKVDETPDPGK